MFLLLLACLAFVSIAMPDAMLGVAWPSMRVSFDQPLSAAGLVPPVGVAATLVSTVTAGYLVRRMGHGRLLAISTLLSAPALVIGAASGAFWHFLISVALIGLASGAIDVTLNAYATRFFGPRQISLLHACYGIGAALAPLVVTGLLWLGESWRWAYALVAAAQLVLGIVFAATAKRWHQPAAPSVPGTHQRADQPRSDGRNGPAERPRTDRRAGAYGPTRAGRRDRLARSGAAWVGVLAAAVHTGVESTVALWAFVFLTEGAGVPAVPAGALASGFWVMLAGGRIVLGQVAERVGAWPEMGWGVGALVLAAASSLVPEPSAAIVAILLFGLGAAPVFPMLMLTTAERVGPDLADRMVGWQAAASALGGATLPALAGLSIGVFATGLAPILAAACLMAGVLQVAMRRLRDVGVRG